MPTLVSTNDLTTGDLVMGNLSHPGLGRISSFAPTPPSHWWQLDAIPFVDSVGNWDFTNNGVSIGVGTGPDGRNCGEWHYSDNLVQTARVWPENQYTVGGMYLNTSQTSSVGNYLLNHRDSGGNVHGLAYRTDATPRVQGVAWDAAATSALAEKTGVGGSLNVWYHLMMTVDMVADVIVLYLDGVEVDRTTSTGQTTAVLDPVDIYFGVLGTAPTNPAFYHLGRCEGWGLWDSVLDQDNINFYANVS